MKLFLVSVFFLTTFISPGGFAESRWRLFESPEPFSLDSQAAQTCIDLLHSAQFVMVTPPNEPPQIIPVKQVWAHFVEFDENQPLGYQKRYNIYLNGTPIDWKFTKIDYGGEMISLQLLFTYRNQIPSRDLEF